MSWTDIASKIEPDAPALAKLLNGPTASFAQSALGASFDIAGEATPDAVETAITSAGAQAADKEKAAEADAIEKIGKAVDSQTLMEKQFDDLKDARAHTLGAKDWWINPVLAVAVTAGFFTSVWVCLHTPISPPANAMADTLLGVLGTAWVSIITFYFGSSNGSKEKTKLLASQLASPPGSVALPSK